MYPRDAHRERIEARLDRLDVEISRLALRTDRAAPRHKAPMLHELRALRRLQAAALQAVAVMEASCDADWDGARTLVEAACSDLARALARVHGRFDRQSAASGFRPYPAATGALPSGAAPRFGRLSSAPAPRARAPGLPADPRRWRPAGPARR